jgi:hypothetical protein
MLGIATCWYYTCLTGTGDLEAERALGIVGPAL